MAKQPANSTGSAPAPANPPAAAPETVKRTRNSFSKEKKLGFMLLSVLTILARKEIQALLTEDQKAKIEKAKKASEAIGAEDPFKAINARIVEIQGELSKLQQKPVSPTNNEAFLKYVASAKELTNELDRQLKRRTTITETLGL